MRKLSLFEKTGITLIVLSLIAVFLKVFEIEQVISKYRSYLASIGAVFWYIGWTKRKKSTKET